MKPQTHLWIEPVVLTDGQATISATIEGVNRQPRQLWYRVPQTCQSWLTQSADPFVVATVMQAMIRKTDLVVHGEVSPSLLRNLEVFQSIWSSWEPRRYSRIGIHADVEREADSDIPSLERSQRAIAAFSGGVDACFTVLHHRTELAGRLKQPLQAGLMVHGFDIPLEDTPGFEQAVVKSRVILSSRNVDLIPMATNFRQVLQTPWEDGFGAAIASCLMLLQRRFSAGLIGSSYAYSDLIFPCGSTPLTDPLLSNQAFSCVHDGAQFTRLEKLQALLAWDEAMQYLRVCWQGKQRDRNCGQCEKCVRNLLLFMILGVRKPACFSQTLKPQQIVGVRVRGRQLKILQAVLKQAQQQGIGSHYVQALKLCILKNQIIEATRSVVKPTV
ncbi:hypothetical protein H6G89_09415 [Oscillatoria sp. FACHB-1407]|uniref:hypothetical protein n=1 Tax=Oscillatoria sp. FACHB-1407 TaxID=2692847 RepID=UPI0016848187|nr:hypothetical protein [Oscillatoria sp. FACHB-1407]MBD2461263.1 hypothetical protein [Oscillatoria sp. FACHB-1407]